MSLGTLSVCLTILLMNMYHNSPEAPPPACIRQYLQRKLKHRNGEGEGSDLYYTGTITKENNGKKYHLHNSLKVDQKFSSPSGSLTKHCKHTEHEATDLTVLGPCIRENEYEREGVCQTILNGGDTIHKSNHKVKVLRFANPAVDDCVYSPALDTPTKEPAVEIDKKQQIRQEWQEFVCLLDKIFFTFVTFTMLLTSFFLLFLPWIRSAS